LLKLKKKKKQEKATREKQNKEGRDEGCSATTLEKIFPNKWKEDPVGEYRVEKYKILFKTKFNI